MSDNESKGHVPAGLILKPQPLPPCSPRHCAKSQGAGQGFHASHFGRCAFMLRKRSACAFRALSDCFYALFASKGQEKTKDFHGTVS